MMLSLNLKFINVPSTTVILHETFQQAPKCDSRSGMLNKSILPSILSSYAEILCGIFMESRIFEEFIPR